VIDTFKANTRDAVRLPKPILNLNWGGAGTDNLARSAKPEEYEMPSTARIQQLVRVDSASLCRSDFRVMRQGKTHNKLHGRDLRTKAAKATIEPKQDSGFFEHLGTNRETRVPKNI